MLANLNVKIGADISSLTGQIKKAQGQLSRFADQTNNLGKKLTVGVTTPLALLGARAIKTAMEFEDLRTSFEVLTGSAEQAVELFDELRKFSASTPFETKDLADATKTMLAFGITVEDSQEYLRMLGDVSLGNSEKLKGLTLAFAQVQSAGKLMGQDLMQMINQGFNPLQALSQKTGKSIGELKEEMSRGAITADMVAEAFKIATSQGGAFFGGMEKGSATLSGVFSTLQDNVTGALGELGEEIVKVFDLKQLVKDVTKKLQEFTKAFTNMSDEVKRRIIGIATIIGVGGPLLIAISAIMRVFAMLNLKVLLIVGVLALVGFACQVLADNFDTLKKRTLYAFKFMTLAVADFVLAFLESEKFIGLAVGSMGQVMNIGLNAVASGLLSTAGGLRAMRNQAEEDMSAMKSVGLGAFTSLSDSMDNFKNNIKTGLNNAFDFLIDTMMGFGEQAEDTAESIEKVEESTIIATRGVSRFKKILEGLKPTLQSITAEFLNVSLDAFTQSLFNAGKFNTEELELRRNGLKQQELALDDSLKRQKESLLEKLEEGKISQAQYNEQIRLLEEQKVLQSAQIQRELADIEQQFNRQRTSNFKIALEDMVSATKQAVKEIIAELTKTAIIKGFSFLLKSATGGVGGFLKGVFDSMLGISGKAVGGPVFGKTPYIVGERGPELFVPNRSGSIVPNGQLMGKSTTMGTSDIRLGGEFRIKGTDLVLAINEANYKLGR